MRVRSEGGGAYMIEPGASLPTEEVCKEEHHLEVFKKNWYPTFFIHFFSLQVPRNNLDDEVKSPLISILYVHVSGEDIRVCHHFNIRVVFKSGWSLQSIPTRAKDTLPSSMSSYICCTPCSYRKVYKGETIRRLEMRTKEHKNAYKKGALEKSAGPTNILSCGMRLLWLIRLKDGGNFSWKKHCMSIWHLRISTSILQWLFSYMLVINTPRRLEYIAEMLTIALLAFWLIFLRAFAFIVVTKRQTHTHTCTYT